MIRIVTTTTRGMLIILGVVDGNLERLRDGQPIHVDLGQMLRQAFTPRGGNGDDDVSSDGRLELAISYGDTHEHIVQELRQAGIPVPEHAVDAARKLDDRLRDEGAL